MWTSGHSETGGIWETLIVVTITNHHDDEPAAAQHHHHHPHHHQHHHDDEPEAAQHGEALGEQSEEAQEVPAVMAAVSS